MFQAKQLLERVMGNSLTSNYDVNQELTTSGPGRLWKLYTCKKHSGGSATLFSFEKGTVELFKGVEQDGITELLKYEAQMMTRLRHPCILGVMEPFQAGHLSVGFISEHVLCNLSMIYAGFKGYELDDFEIRKGLLQLSSALRFLHSNRIHVLCVSPDSVYINAKGDWKLGGFAYSKKFGDSFHLSQITPYCSPPIAYMAPNVILDGQCDISSDVWSLGAFIMSLYLRKAPMECGNNVSLYRDLYHRMTNQFPGMPSNLQAITSRMLSRQPPSLSEFESCSFFNDLMISTIQFLELFAEKTQVERAQFLKELPSRLPNFSLSVVTRKILPLLIHETINPPITAFILPSLFWIGEQLSTAEFEEKLLPTFNEILTRVHPPQATLLLLSRMDLLISKCTSLEAILPNYITALKSPQEQIQESAAKSLPKLIPHFSGQSIQTIIYPTLKALFPSGKPSVIAALSSIIPSLDKYTITEQLLPSIPQLKSTPVMGIVSLYQAISQRADKEQIATIIIPNLWKLTMHPSLSLAQFQTMTSLLNDLSTRIQREHSEHLRSTHIEEKVEAPVKSMEYLSMQPNVSNAMQPRLSTNVMQPNLSSHSDLNFSIMQPKVSSDLNLSIMNSNMPMNPLSSSRPFSNNNHIPLQPALNIPMGMDYNAYREPTNQPVMIPLPTTNNNSLLDKTDWSDFDPLK